jgi:hypothetical protein
MAWGGGNNRGGGGQQQNRGGGNGGGNGGNYDNTNRGALFENDKKNSDKHPDHKGSCDIQCPACGATFAMWLSGWFKTAKQSGAQFMSLSFQAKEENGNGGGGNGGERSQGNGQGGGQNRGQGGGGGWQGNKRAGPNVSGSWRNKGGDIEDEIPFR